MLEIWRKYLTHSSVQILFVALAAYLYVVTTPNMGVYDGD